MLIGGSEDREGTCDILRKFVELVGGKAPSIAVMTVAAGKVTLVGATCREDAQARRG